MPDATVQTESTEQINLKSLEGAWVSLKPLSFGKKLERRDKATKLSYEQSRNNADPRMVLDMYNRWQREFDFANCIVGHNLTDKNNAALNFQNPMTLDILHPKVGSELERLIDELNGEEDEGDLDDFLSVASSASTEETPLESEESPQESSTK